MELYPVTHTLTKNAASLVLAAALSALSSASFAHSQKTKTPDVDCSDYPEWSESSPYVDLASDAGKIVVWDGVLWRHRGRDYPAGEPGQDSRWKKIAACLPEPTYTPADSQPGFDVTPGGEVYLPVSPERLALHQANHEYFPLVTAIIPPFFDPPTMDKIDDFVLTKDDLVVINPAPDEFLWIMEGKRHGYEELAIVLTNTPTGNGAPLHTHVGEESHVLLKGKMRYFLNGEDFVVEAPYIVNIPSMVPHAFMNVDDEPAQLVGIFPASNTWEYDVLAASVFEAETADADPLGFPGDDTPATAAKGEDHFSHFSEWHGKANRDRRMRIFRETYGQE